MLKKIAIIPIFIFAFFSVLSANLAAMGNNTQQEKNIQKPDFSVTDMTGKTYTDESTNGKYLVVNFWATWCPPCRKEMPDFVEFFENNKHQVLILGMDYENADKDVIQDFLDNFLVNYPIILFDESNKSQFTKFGQVRGMPTTFIYDPKGNLIDFHEGEMNIKDLEKAMPNAVHSKD